MKIKKISLLNFRNCKKTTVEFNESLNILIGDNAQGKTNILESIVILALTKSHRMLTNPNVIMFDKSKSQINGVVKNDKVISKLKIDFTVDSKTLYVNNTNIKRVADYISYLNVIVFTPDDLDVIKGSPNIRRNLLNIQLSQMSKTYLDTYNQYNKLLKTRNEYLKILFNNSISDKKYLDVLTDKLIEKEIIIFNKRKEYIDLINKQISYFYKEISGFDNLQIEYVTNIGNIIENTEDFKQELKNLYNKNITKELNYGMTLYGPHRDDFSFKINGKDLKFYGSQGQQKLAILAFKLSEISIFEYFCNTKPILLLDDIFSELDLKKRNKLLKFINSSGVQTIITTTDLKNINKKYLENSYIYEVNSGNIKRK